MTTMTSRQEMKMANYFQAPNEMIDSIVGEVLSGNAAWVVMTVWRYTEGMTDKTTGKKRKSAPIPTGAFKRVLGTNRNNTAYRYIKEAVDSGLINVQKANGKTSVYSINKQCKHWYKSVKPVAESDIGLDMAESVTSVEKRLRPMSETATGTSVGKRHTYKEIYKEICTKENKEKNKKEKPKPEPPRKKRKHDFVEFEFTDTQKSKCSEYGINISSLLTEFRDYHEARGNQFVDWSKAFNTWINNHIKFNKLSSVSNGVNHASNQPDSQNNTAKPQNHFDLLRAELRAKYGTSDEPKIRTVNPSFGAGDEYV